MKPKPRYCYFCDIVAQNAMPAANRRRQWRYNGLEGADTVEGPRSSGPKSAE